MQVQLHPAVAKLRYVSLNRQTEIERHILDQVSDGVLEPSTSPWASTVHLVAKPDRTARLVNNYVEVNKQLMSDTYHLLLKQSVPFDWNDDCKAAYEHLLHSLA